MIVLGIDPGYEKVGVAIVSKEISGKENLLFSGCIKTDKKESHAERLCFIGKEIEKIIEKYEPKTLAVEKLFFNTNQKTALLVSEARGVILFTAQKRGLFIQEFTPPQIKLATTGDGRADKKQIVKMLSLLIKIPSGKKEDDEFDAIAVAITCLALGKKNS